MTIQLCFVTSPFYNVVKATDPIVIFKLLEATLGSISKFKSRDFFKEAIESAVKG